MSDGYRKSRRCGSSACPEVDTSQADRGHVTVRDSKWPDVWIGFTTDEWRTFVAAIKDGEFDVPEEG